MSEIVTVTTRHRDWRHPPRDPTSIMEMGTLPLDILLYIIDLLAGGDDGDVKSLQILSQLCKSMVPLCRKHLFSSLLLYAKRTQSASAVCF